MLNRIRWEVGGLFIFCWYWVNCWLSQNVQNVWFRALSIHYVINITKWEVVVYFVDMGWINIVDQQYLNTWGAQGLKPYILCSMIRGEENVVHFFFLYEVNCWPSVFKHKGRVWFRGYILCSMIWGEKRRLFILLIWGELLAINV